MKIVHLSDLHLGKRVNEFSMLEDQRYILTKIINIIDDEKPEAVIIAGDVYDRSNPPDAAVQLLDDFLCRLAERSLQVFVISGNHDSSEKLAFGSRLMDHSGVHLSRVYDGNVEPITLQDEHGDVNFYMLPFVKSIHVRSAFPDAEIATYSDAVSFAVQQMNLDAAARNIIVTHQFVTGATRSDSEEVSVGGSDNIDASIFDDFDYVALGHIHGPQNIGSERIRYCGTPLKYSFSEMSHTKSVTVVDMGAKGTMEVKTVPLVPHHDMREIRGKYADLVSKENYEGTAVDDYLRVVLTDEEDVMDALTRLRTVYPNIMKLEYDNTRTRSQGVVHNVQNMDEKSPMELFSSLFEIQNGQELSDEQKDYIESLITEIWEGSNETN